MYVDKTGSIRRKKQFWRARVAIFAMETDQLGILCITELYMSL